MDKQVQVQIATGVAGLLVGFAGGYILSEKRNVAKYRKLADDEINTMREKYRGYREDLSDKVRDERRVLQEEQDYLVSTAKLIKRKYGVEDVYKDLNDLEEPSEEEEYKEIVSDYQSEDNVEEEAGVYVPADKLSELGHVDEDQKKPYFIDEEVFSLNEKHYTQSMLTYFINDNLLLDELDQVINDVNGLVGDKLVEIKLHDDIDLAYIRNNRLLLELEIVVERESFAAFAERVGLSGP